MQLAKILLPVDFSERATAAAHYAKTLACHFHSELNIVHAFEMQNLAFSGEISMPAGWYEDVRNDSQRRLAECYASQFQGMPARRELLDGDAALAIVNFAHKEHIDLIVMPTHGFGRFRRFVLGSVTAKILHDTDCPVLTGVHLQEPPPLEPILLRNIVCAVDFDAAGEKALRWAAEFAGEFGSRLTVVHALPDISVGPSGYVDPALPALLRQAAEERMDALQKQVGTTAGVILEVGSVANVVRDASALQKADLVVVGRHESAGLLGRLRANAYAIVRESPCPVISV